MMRSADRQAALAAQIESTNAQISALELAAAAERVASRAQNEMQAMIRGDIEDFFTFKLSAEKKCFLRPLVSAEVSLHALASMIEKLHTQTSFTIHWQSITSSA